MIINHVDSKKIKILLDENDLKKSNISIKKWLCNPQKINEYIKKILENNSINTNPNKILNYTEINIYTYNFKIYCIELKYN